VSVQNRCIAYAYVPSAQKLFWRHSTELIGDEAQVKARSFSEIVQILTQDRCTVCIKRTIGIEIILDASDGTPR
jgi:hypothetical protein